MSMSFYWQPANKGACLDVPMPSDFLRQLQATFGAGVVGSTTFCFNDQIDWKILNALAQCGGPNDAAYSELADAVEQYENITVTGRS